jgi:glycosyltransferase involved in cell wall biosynthesis
MIPKISICIPTWEQHGFGEQYLSKLLDSIETQTIKDVEVVISDHSISDVIFKVVE